MDPIIPEDEVDRCPECDREYHLCECIVVCVLCGNPDSETCNCKETPLPF